MLSNTTTLNLMALSSQYHLGHLEVLPATTLHTLLFNGDSLCIQICTKNYTLYNNIINSLIHAGTPRMPSWAKAKTL